MEKIVQRFMEYVQIETTSNSDSQTCPSTEGQFVFARHLAKELEKIGLANVDVDENGYVMATLPSNMEKDIPAIGFVAHMDTSPDMYGNNVKPRIVTNYDGEAILLNKELDIKLSPRDFPELKNYIGQDIIVTDGTTLLGADDKAGVAAIVSAMEYLINHPEVKHGEVKIAFTPDEEIGRGADRFDVLKFGAKFAYTVDGGELGELEYENFNAAEAKITIQGRNVHPGSSKNKMRNALLIAMELNAMLPPAEIPAHTEGYEGFYHLNKVEGTVEQAKIQYIIRDHDKQRFLERKARVEAIAAYLNDKYGAGTISLNLRDQYYNMREKIEAVIEIIDLAKEAMEAAGVRPLITPVRGGTDGARLSFKGLPCPNIFTGGHNYHGKFEYLPIQSLKKSAEVVLKIIELHSSR